MTFKEKLKTTRWKLEDHINTDEEMIAYIEVALEDNNPAFLADVLGIIAKKRGMAKIAKATGLTREGLYKSLSAQGNPELGTFLKVISALGLHLRVEAAPITPAKQPLEAHP